jgi:solute carrier family 50 protein (sugar transporter)
MSLIVLLLLFILFFLYKRFIIPPKDPFVFYANAPGLMLSLWLNITAIKLQYSQMLNCFGNEDHSDTQSAQDQTEADKNARTLSSRKVNSALFPSAKPPGTVPNERLLYFIALIWIIILSSVGLLPWLEHSVKVNIVGICSNINLIFFFGAPLSSIAVVLRLRSSQPIHRKTLLLNTLNASFWCIYGISIHDYFIVAPNLAGLSLGFIQLLLCVIFPQEIYLVQEEQSMQLNELAGSTDSHEVTLDR